MTLIGPSRSSRNTTMTQLGWTIGFDPAGSVRTSPRSRVLIGAAPHCDIIVADCGAPVIGYVDEHAALHVLGDEPWVFLNGRRAKSETIQPGNLMTVGSTTVVWREVDVEEAAQLIDLAAEIAAADVECDDDEDVLLLYPTESALVAEHMSRNAESLRPRVAPPVRRGLSLGNVLARANDGAEQAATIPMKAHRAA